MCACEERTTRPWSQDSAETDNFVLTRFCLISKKDPLDTLDKTIINIRLMTWQHLSDNDTICNYIATTHVASLPLRHQNWLVKTNVSDLFRSHLLRDTNKLTPINSKRKKPLELKKRNQGFLRTFKRFLQEKTDAWRAGLLHNSPRKPGRQLLPRVVNWLLQICFPLQKSPTSSIFVDKRETWIEHAPIGPTWWSPIFPRTRERTDYPEFAKQGMREFSESDSGTN
jgi:hypothetical protein